MKKLLLAAITAATITFTACKKDETPAPVTPTKNYSKVMLSSIKINSIPFTTHLGTSWDANGGLPDVYITLYESSTGLNSSYRAAKYDDVGQKDFPISWNYQTPQTLDTSATYMINVYDADIDPTKDEPIGYTGFEARTLIKNNYPDSFIMENGLTKITISLKYQ